MFEYHKKESHTSLLTIIPTTASTITTSTTTTISTTDITYNIDIYLNNFTSITFTNSLIDLLSYVLSIINLKYILKIKLVTVYPKFYIRTIIININNEIEIYDMLDKIVRNRKYVRSMTSTDNITNDTMTTINKLITDIDTTTYKPINMIFIADSDCLFMRDILKNINTEHGFYCHTCKQIKNDIPSIFNQVQISDDACFKSIHNVLIKILHINNVQINNISHIFTRSLFFKDSMHQISDMNIIEIKNYDDKNIISEWNNYHCLKILGSLSDARYILSLNVTDIKDYHVEVYNKINVLINNESILNNFNNKANSNSNNKNNSNNKIHKILLKTLCKIMQNISHKHTSVINNHNLNNVNLQSVLDNTDNNTNTDDITNKSKIIVSQPYDEIKNYLENLKCASSHFYDRNYTYFSKKVDYTYMSKIYDEIAHIYTDVDNFLEQINDIEDLFQETVSADNSDIYITSLTMSEWCDELRRGDCVGIALSIKKNPYKKGRYEIELNNLSICVGSMSEMFNMLQDTTIKSKSNINIENNTIIKNEEIDMSCNCVIPLYISELHWKIGKIYLNPVCNMIMYDSLIMNNESAWKIMYVMFMHIGREIVAINKDSSDTKIGFKSIKYMMSLWLTNNIISRENNYDTGIFTFLNKIINESKFKCNVDPIMIAGQMCCIATPLYDLKYINMIESLLVTDSFAQSYTLIMTDDIYSNNSNNSDNNDNTKEIDKANKIDAEKFIAVFKNKCAKIFDMIYFIHVCRDFFCNEIFESMSHDKLHNILKQNFGIPPHDILKCFENAMNNVDKNKVIMHALFNAEYNDVEINSAITDYRQKFITDYHQKLQIQSDTISTSISTLILSSNNNSNSKSNPNIICEESQNKNQYQILDLDIIVDKIMNALSHINIG